MTTCSSCLPEALAPAIDTGDVSCLNAQEVCRVHLSCRLRGTNVQNFAVQAMKCGTLWAALTLRNHAGCEERFGAGKMCYRCVRAEDTLVDTTSYALDMGNARNAGVADM